MLRVAEVWWHLPLLVLALAGLGAALSLLRSWLRTRRAKKAERIMENLYSELWDAWLLQGGRSSFCVLWEFICMILHIIENMCDRALFIQWVCWCFEVVARWCPWDIAVLSFSKSEMDLRSLGLLCEEIYMSSFIEQWRCGAGPGVSPNYSSVSPYVCGNSLFCSMNIRMNKPTQWPCMRRS